MKKYYVYFGDLLEDDEITDDAKPAAICVVKYTDYECLKYDRDIKHDMAAEQIQALNEQLHQAHRAGWEQGKAEATMLSFSCACHKAIANMEYKGNENDKQRQDS